MQPVPRRLPYIRVLALIAILVTSLSSTASASLYSEGSPDLVAMLLRTDAYDDLASLDGDVVRYGGSCYTTPQYASSVAEYYGMDPAEMTADLQDIGLLDTCESYHGLPSQPGERSAAVVFFRSYVHSYEDEDAAADGFAYLEDESDDPSLKDIPEGEGLADESEATISSGEDDNGAYNDLDLSFRTGSMHAGITITDYTGGTPDPEVAIALAEVLLDQIDTALQGDAPNLGSMLAPMTGEGLPPIGAVRYDVFDGEGEMFLGENAEAFQERAATWNGEENILFMGQVIPPAEGERPIQYGTYLQEFGSDDEAIAYVEDTMQRLQDNEDNLDIVENDSVAEYGDASIAVHYGSMANGMESQLDRMYIAVDNLVINTYLVYTTMPMGVVESSAAIQVACVENGGCSDTVPVPEAFGGPAAPSTGLNPGNSNDRGADESSTRSSIARIGQKSTSTEDRQQSADDSTGRQAATDERYESDEYPFAIDYSDDWAMDDPQVIGDMELLTMSNGLSGVVIIVDTSHEGDVDACLDGALAYIEDQDDVSSIEVMEDENGNLIEGSSNDLAYTAISYENGDGSEMALYAECRTVAGGEATMEFNQFVPLDAYGDQIDAREELLAGIQIDN